MVDSLFQTSNGTSSSQDPRLTENLLAADILHLENRPFISVAIPHYKHRKYLEIVLTSIFEQEYNDFEIIVSNDRSPDDSDQTIPTILEQSKRRFRYYSQPHNL